MAKIEITKEEAGLMIELLSKLTMTGPKENLKKSIALSDALEAKLRAGLVAEGVSTPQQVQDKQALAALAAVEKRHRKKH